MTITFDSCLSLVPIEIRKDKKNYIVEDQLSGEFYEMPEVCIAALNLFNQGKRLGEIEKELLGKFPNEDVNLLEFAEQLNELDLIAEIDGEKVEKKLNQKERLGFLAIPPTIGKIFFNKLTYLMYFVLFIVNLFLFITQPSLFPHHEDIFVFDIMALNVVLWMSFTFLLLLVHELGHILAMRAHNLPTKLGVGHRMFFVVIETDMSSVWKLAPKERNVLFFAGLCFDMVILFIALVSQLLFPNGSWLFIGLLNLAVFDVVLRIIYQCCIYMKTDLYFVFENVSGCYNLMENAKQNIRNKLSFIRFKGRKEVLFLEEGRTVFLYTILYFLGFVISVALYFIYYIPEIIHAGNHLLPGFSKGPTSLLFWDAVLFSLQVGIFILLLLNSWRKKYLPT
jgi:putative peptide zinc metalloprotease protein